ncbi:MAG: hypothetical protein IJW35_01190 [Lentisphaeria bacterium]|nr:hypothetical protein [Lentisphaeria bacterium]
MKFSGKKLYFIPGICWGGLWIREFFLYPELWFFACCAVGIGVGFIIPKMVKSSWRDGVGLAALAGLALVPEQELHSALFPLVFGYYSGCILTAEPGNWQASRSFSGGFMLGAVVAVSGVNEIFLPLLLICTACNLPAWWKKIAAVVLAAVIFSAGELLTAKAGSSTEKPVPSPGEMITALSWVEPGTKAPKMAFFGGEFRKLAANTNEFAGAAKVSYHDSVSSIPSDAEVIFAVDVPEIGDGGVRECARKLRDGGVMVLPAGKCGILPHWQWRQLPGGAGNYAVAGKGRELKFDPDKMDANFAALFGKHHPNPPLAGALAGMLICENPRPVTLHGASGGRWYWGVALGLLTALLTGYLWRQRRNCGYRKDQWAAMFNTGGQALLTAVLLPGLLEWFNLPGVTNILIALGAVWFIRRSTGLRSRRSRNISWLIFWLSMIFSVVLQQEIFMFAALIFGGSAYADLDGELQKNFSCPAEEARFLAIACGIGAAWLMIHWQIPWAYQLLIAAGARFYSWVRN